MFTLTDLADPKILFANFKDPVSNLIDIYRLSNYIEKNVLDLPTRKRNGVYFTPQSLSDLAIRNITMKDGETAIDTACGIGNLLIPLARKSSLPLYDAYLNVFGIEINSDFIEIAKAIMASDTNSPKDSFSKCFRCLDFMNTPISDTIKYDILVINPPYLSGIRNSIIDKNDKVIKGGSNICFQYLYKSMDLLKHPNRIGAILPSSFLHNHHLTTIRNSWSLSNYIKEIWYIEPNRSWFNDTLVNTCVIYADNTNSSTEILLGRFPSDVSPHYVQSISSSNWSHLFLSDEFKDLGTYRTITEQFNISSGLIVSEAYECSSFITDCQIGEGKKFVTSGMLTADKIHWGSKKKRILKNQYTYPRLAPNALFSKSLNAKLLDSRSKIIVSGLSVKLIAFYDRLGEYLPGAGTFIITHHTNDLEKLRLLWESLNSDKGQAYMRAVLETKRLSAQSYPISKDFLCGFPLEF